MLSSGLLILNADGGRRTQVIPRRNLGERSLQIQAVRVESSLPVAAIPPSPWRTPASGCTNVRLEAGGRRFGDGVLRLHVFFGLPPMTEY